MNNTLKAVMLMSEEVATKALAWAEKSGISIEGRIVSDLEGLERSFCDNYDLLLSFGKSVIVPRWILELEGLLAVNVHAASPHYPGRDPHHFAAYDGVNQYGAVMHYMAPTVDSGPIIDVELFDVPMDTSPSHLLELARKASLLLIERFFLNYAQFGAPLPNDQLMWQGRKSTREMFLEMCRIDHAMTKQEVERRYKSTKMPGFSNLYIDIHGYRFRLHEDPE